MTANEGGIDRLVRLVLGIALAALAWFYMAALGTVWAAVIGIAGVILVVTAAIGWCPLYAMFGISTSKTRKTS